MLSGLSESECDFLAQCDPTQCDPAGALAPPAREPNGSRGVSVGGCRRRLNAGGDAAAATCIWLG